jgi:hypothetical protein
VLAVHYYNQKQANTYNIKSYFDRQRAERRFSKALAQGRIQKETLENAYFSYLKGLEEDYQRILKEAI